MKEHSIKAQQIQAANITTTTIIILLSAPYVLSIVL